MGMTFPNEMPEYRRARAALGVAAAALAHGGGNGAGAARAGGQDVPPNQVVDGTADDPGVDRLGIRQGAVAAAVGSQHLSGADLEWAAGVSRVQAG